MFLSEIVVVVRLWRGRSIERELSELARSLADSAKTLSLCPAGNGATTLMRVRVDNHATMDSLVSTLTYSNLRLGHLSEI